MQLNNSECIFSHTRVSNAYLKLNLKQNRHISCGDKPRATDRHSPQYAITIFTTYNSLIMPVPVAVRSKA